MVKTGNQIKQNFDQALIVIDVQNDFCHAGALEVPDGDAVVAKINEVARDFEIKILTQDWHPKGHVSFASSHDGRALFEMIDLSYGKQVLWPDHCVQGTHGANFHSELMTDSASAILRKGFHRDIDSYSAFFENDRKTPTGLEGYLRTRDVRKIVCVGLATDYCVCYSAADAARLGLEVEVWESCCRAIDQDGSLSEAHKLMRDAGVTLK